MLQPRPMTKPTRIWIASSHHAAFKCGGWAYVRQDASGVSGRAGGERYVTAARMALAGLVEALREAPKGPIAVQIDQAEVARVAGLLAAGLQPQGEAAPGDDLDLWAQLAAGLTGRAATFTLSAADKAAPSGFAAAWAELARDKANAQGAFASAIPRPNLAKVPGLGL